jgi:hypothetical protein
MGVSSVDQFEPAFKEAIQARSAALVVTQETLFASNWNVSSIRRQNTG